YREEILFFRLGDFYEMFFDDAKTASRELELTLTGKDCGLAERAPMCGVPFHSAETYISRLVQKGYKVAICEQLTDPKESKTLVERGVVRVVTPGTVVEQSMLDEKRNSFLLALCVDSGRAGIAYADVSTGECAFVEAEDARAMAAEMTRVAPMEIIANEAAMLACAGQRFSAPVSVYTSNAWQLRQAEKCILDHFGAQNLDSFGLRERPLAVRATGALLSYINETQRNAMSHISTIRHHATGKYMVLDMAARRNLELTETIRRGRGKGTLLHLLDRTTTSMGARLLSSWVEQPLAERETINARLDAVAALKASPMLMQNLRDTLREVRDVERISGRISYNTLNARHCLALRQSFDAVPQVMDLIAGCDASMLRILHDTLDPMDDIVDAIDRMIDPDAPLSLSEGGVIRSGFNDDLDALRRAGTEGKQWIAEMEAQERETTGIKNLRISFHKIFGYCIEVTKSNYELVPLRYIRRQTLANSERYVTPELQEMEKQILGAAERAVRLEQRLFAALKEQLETAIARMQRTAECLKTLDALLSMAITAQDQGYVRPEMTDDGAIEILDGRHPVVETMLRDEPFVPNSTHMNLEDQRMLIVTGPNMAGKSTYMRQVALITLMAHIGSFVPAKSARICLTDRIFTRIGASDDLSSGQSTFLVEMSETAQILRNATHRSLIILDEIGRGTSTFDGLSIAWAVVEFLCSDAVGAKTLFATHYHELSELEGRLPGVVNFRIAVKEHGEDVIFLRRIERGGADKSFGIHVARLAGVPQPVVARAQEILARLEAADVNQASIGANILEENRTEKQAQVGFMDMGAVELTEELRALDVNSMTPMEALNTLFALREKARRA
ncbi:DNA mismatch repair protein MutS, partial [Eubacteriales bacterium OttesenSCG-928-A19]|nr:DNA mismatch repair protein MutS [Eubacteriales bacterium OttesenSCG-928-A19]